MLHQIISFLLDVAAGLLGGACLLRLYMQAQRVPFGNPVGRFVFAVTDWLVLPLRKGLPAVGRWDTASLVGAWLIVLAQFGVLWLVSSGGAAWLPVLATFGVVRLAISGLMGLVIVYAVLSWVQSDAPLVEVISRLCTPLLRPLRRWIPLVGGIDLSPLALLVILQIAAMVLAAVQGAVLF
ncbi:MAG: YggT family protein [Ramlibacter sp.]|nr:YggT family protein [Ramlibacter sp.]